MPQKKAPRNCCGTINNYTESATKMFIEYCKAHASYWVFGFEIGENETPHMQYYVEFATQRPFKEVHTAFSHAHLEPRKGTPKQAAGYCKKGVQTKNEIPPPHPKCYSYFYDNPSCTWEGMEEGELSHQGKRTDLTNVVEDIQAGATMLTVARQYPEQFVKYNRGLHNLRATLLPPRSLDTAPEVMWLYGPTGTGKTRDAYTKYWPEVDHYVWRPSNGNWWDGYDGQTKIILDEFRGQMTWSDILGLLDRNEYRAPIKGGFTQIQADRFVITSPLHPDLVYKDDDRHDRKAQLLRRITKVVHYSDFFKKEPPPEEPPYVPPWGVSQFALEEVGV